MSEGVRRVAVAGYFKVILLCHSGGEGGLGFLELREGLFLRSGRGV